MRLKILKTDPVVVHVSAGDTVRAKDNCFVGKGTRRYYEMYGKINFYNGKLQEKMG